MRETYRQAIDAISDELIEMTWSAGSAITRASIALLDADLALAESVIAADDHLDQVQRDLEERAFDLLARQQPVATDLRIIVTSLRMSADLERMGDLARHVAKVTRLRYPKSAIPPQLRGTLLEMAQIAERIVAKAGSVIASKDVTRALELERDDDDMDRLHRQLFTLLLADDWLGGVEQAIDITLIGRYYERFADHAVSVARGVVYLVTGERADKYIA
jgi:phosphate transport system protein